MIFPFSAHLLNMNLLFVLHTICVILALTSAKKQTFHNYSVYSITPNNTVALNILKDWEETRYNEFNFWSPVTTLYNPVDIMVPQHLKGFVERIAKTTGMSSKIFIENVQELIDKEKGQNILRSGSFGWTSYHTLDEVSK